MKASPLVSCIIPVYNAEKYLEHGIKSLLSQTYDNLEVILVDDVSTDSSWDICQKYANEYPNILAFRNNRNSGGPLRGRERGIRESHGEWITFMDCDDFVKPEYIQHLVETTEDGKYDIAVTGYSRLYPDGRVEPFLWGNYFQPTKKRLATFYQHFIDEDFWTDPTDTAGQNLVRAEIAKRTDLSKYPDRVWAEDTLMALSFLENSKNGVNFSDHHDFYWRQRPGSGSNGGFSNTANKPAFYRACYEIFDKNNLLPLVSVIVPIFNVDKYLRDCIDSLLNQTYPNIEVILIDDKSPDKSGLIADEYANKEKRVRVIHKKRNEGLNMARATVFNVSSGDYILFVDSDDLLTEDCIRAALTALIKNKTDFARFGMVMYKNKKDLQSKLQKLPEEKEIVLTNKKELYKTLLDQRAILGSLPVLSMTVWGAIYTKNLVNQVDWKSVNYKAYEDNIWTLKLLEKASSGAYISHVGYLYRYDESITNVLSKSLTGNNLNGKPIGYMEGLDYIRNEFSRINEKYKICDNKVIENETDLLFMFRAKNLTKANLWDVEGNEKYLTKVVKIYQERLDQIQQENSQKDAHIATLELENTRINNELTALQVELRSYLSIKRSVKLAAGNVKRRIKRQLGSKLRKQS